MHTKHFITVNVKYGVYGYPQEIETDENGNHNTTLSSIVRMFSNDPYRDEILLNGEVVESEEQWYHILQDGDTIEGRPTPEGDEKRAERRRLEEERLRNRSIGERFWDGVEAIFNPFGL